MELDLSSSALLNSRLSRAIFLYRDYLPAHFAGVEFINAWRAGRKLGGQLISFKFPRRPDSPPSDDGDPSVHGCTANPDLDAAGSDSSPTDNDNTNPAAVTMPHPAHQQVLLSGAL